MNQTTREPETMVQTVYSITVPAGDVIFRQGEEGRVAYIIERGKVEVSIDQDGRKSVIAELGDGEIFGEMSIIDDAPRSATVTAVADTALVVVQRARFQKPIAAANPLMKLLLRVVLSRFRDAQRQLSGLRDNSRTPDTSLEEVRKLALKRITIEREMRGGLEASEFVMHYQPIISLETGGIAGFEALMRWQKGDGSFVSPAEFVTLAEETGFIGELGRWSMEESLAAQIRFAEATAAAEAGSPAPFMSINVSGYQLSELTEIAYLADIIESSGVDPERIKLEMTETLLVQDPEHAAKALREIKKSGVSLAIDDFGTGFSSLSYLHQFPLDTLKIDREFVNNMESSESSERIVSSIAQLAHSLNMSIVAEGIEKTEQISALRDLGCQFGQGYLMSKPLPADEVMALIRSKPRW
ncbi:MAG: EAL domain-containing protein [Rhodospirillales bacterium]